MDELISVIVMVIYIIVALTSGKNKKKKAARRSARNKTVQFDLPSEGSDPCHESMLPQERPSMRVQSVTQEAMHAAGEGVDPCHTIDAAPLLEEEELDSPVYRSPIFDPSDRETFAQDVLRGVVMSEILTRPPNRLGNSRMKRGA